MHPSVLPTQLHLAQFMRTSSLLIPNHDPPARQPATPMFMKSSLALFFTLMGCCFAEDPKSASQPLEAKVEKDHVCLKVAYQTQFADAQSCTLNYVLSNTDGTKHVTLFSGCAFDPDIQIRLVAPSGKVLTAYKDMPGAKFPAIQPQALFSENLTSRGYDHYLDLRYLFPIEEKGEYRCTLTKRVFRQEAAGALSTPVDLVSPEFKFTIEKVDADSASPLAKHVPSLNHPQPTQEHLTATSMHHASNSVGSRTAGIH